MRKRRQSGFTLLEVMIAIAIFGFLMLYTSQLMSHEIHLFNSALKENELQQKARTALMHTLDEIRLHAFTFYSDSGQGTDTGVYYSDTGQNGSIRALVIQNPHDPESLPAGTVYWEAGSQRLWFKRDDTEKYLIADQISVFSITEASSSGTRHLIKIEVTAGDAGTAESYRLVTWARLY
ncbi:PilW family protein [Paradesulfitobacterium ferrireducens]|uniref:PilW family protein n=1 Tax=Paradesulfitobacterium ferrireducens TaxID=2816476 RepID=UPI001A8CD3AB|nr:type II secretion system protein [Paradesulfitobacterium ferrireducens]